MNARLILIFVIPIILSESILSQDFFYEGSIVTLNKDTVYGKIKDLGLKKNSLLCTFNPVNSNVIVEYQPGEIISYFVNKKYYVSKTIKINNYDTMLFAEYLVDGTLDLFNVQIEKTTYYLIEDDNGTQSLVNINKNAISNQDDAIKANLQRSIDRGTIKLAMKNYPPILEQIDNVLLEDRKSVVRLMTNYHNAICKNEKCIDYTKKDIKPDVYLGFTLGITKSFLSFLNDDRFIYLSDANMKSTSSFLYGINLSFGVPAISERFFLDFIFEKWKESFTYRYNIEYDAISNFKYNSNAYSLHFNYLLIQKKINFSPYVGMSIIGMNKLRENTHIEPGYIREPVDFYKSFCTLNAGINLDITVSDEMGLVLRAKAGYRKDISDLQNHLSLGDQFHNLMVGFTLLKKITK
ncbi:MAG: hypothetical protein R6W78_05570 [Bacteroidales bacterium]